MGALPIILQILTVLPSMISAVEQLLGSKPGQGPSKKELVMSTVRGAAQIAAASGVKELEQPETRKALEDVAGALTDGIVAAFNAAGIFRRESARG